MKQFFAIFALLTLAATAHANSFRSGSYDSDRGFSFDSFDKIVQQVMSGHDNHGMSWGDLNKALKKDDDKDRGKGHDKRKSGSDFGNDLWKKFESHHTETHHTPCTPVPDGGASIVMLGLGLLALAGLKRAVRA